MCRAQWRWAESPLATDLATEYGETDANNPYAVRPAGRLDLADVQL